MNEESVVKSKEEKNKKQRKMRAGNFPPRQCLKMMKKMDKVKVSSKRGRLKKKMDKSKINRFFEIPERYKIPYIDTKGLKGKDLEAMLILETGENLD